MKGGINLKVKDLIDSYNYRNIEAQLQIDDANDLAGVIQFSKEIYASYLRDNEMINTIQLFFPGLTSYKLQEQIDYTIKVLEILKVTLNIFCNYLNDEIDLVMKELGLFNSSFKDGKTVSLNNHAINIKNSNGLIFITIGCISDDA